MKKKFTHTGTMTGCDARVSKDFGENVILRETKLYWITPNGTKFSKKHYGNEGGDWPMYSVDLDSIKPMSEV